MEHLADHIRRLHNQQAAKGPLQPPRAAQRATTPPQPTQPGPRDTRDPAFERLVPASLANFPRTDIGFLDIRSAIYFADPGFIVAWSNRYSAKHLKLTLGLLKAWIMRQSDWTGRTGPASLRSPSTLTLESVAHDMRYNYKWLNAAHLVIFDRVMRRTPNTNNFTQIAGVEAITERDMAPFFEDMRRDIPELRPRQSGTAPHHQHYQAPNPAPAPATQDGPQLPPETETLLGRFFQFIGGSHPKAPAQPPLAAAREPHQPEEEEEGEEYQPDEPEEEEEEEEYQPDEPDEDEESEEEESEEEEEEVEAEQVPALGEPDHGFVPSDKARCHGTKRTGERCTRPAQVGKPCCWQHRAQKHAPKPAPKKAPARPKPAKAAKEPAKAATQCKGTTKKGTRCLLKVKGADFCRFHTPK